MSDCQSISGDDLAILSVVIGLVLSQKLSTDQLNVLGNFVVSIGCALLTIAAQEEALNKNNQEDDTKKQLEEMQKQLDQLLESSKKD